MRIVLLRRDRRDLLNGRRDGHSNRLEHLAATPLNLIPEQGPPPVLFHLHPLQAIQVLDHIGPFQVVAPLSQPGLQLLTEYQRQERTEDMTPDRLITLVED